MKVSPKYMIGLIQKIDTAIWSEYDSYKNVEAYIERWYEDDGRFGDWRNFDIVRREDNDNIDLYGTLSGIKDDELLFKIAVDLGIEIPDLVYSIPEIKGILSSDYHTAAATFENALKKVIEEPNTSICAANSALESIIKHICEDPSIQSCDQKDTLYRLTQHILKEFQYYPDGKLNDNIRNIGSALLTIAQSVEAIRSGHSDTSHGKIADDYIIDDDLYAKFVLNAVTTVGLFLLNYYEKKYKPEQSQPTDYDDIPF